MRTMNLRRQRGLALPVMLIVLVVMLVTSVYLLKSSNSTTMTASNMAYDASLSRAADLGLHAAFDWLSTTSRDNKVLLNEDSPANGYSATLDPAQPVASSGFWTDKRTLDDGAGNTVEYVIHRMCAMPLPYDDANNACVQTSANTAALGTAVALGESLASDAPTYATTPQVHYVITARIKGARGTNVVNQMVVLIGA